MCIVYRGLYEEEYVCVYTWERAMGGPGIIYTEEEIQRSVSHTKIAKRYFVWLLKVVTFSDENVPLVRGKNNEIWPFLKQIFTLINLNNISVLKLKKKQLWKNSKITGQKVSVKKILNWRNIHLIQCISINIVTVLVIRNEFHFSMGKLSRILCRTANFW